MSLFNEEFRKSLELGKYSRWAVDINEDELVRLLQAVDAFIEALNCDGCLSRADVEPFLNSFSAAVEPALEALELIVRIRYNNTSDYEMGSGWDQRFENSRQAFDEQLQRRLATKHQSSWAQHISERDFALLLFMVGRYGTRNLAIMHQDLRADKIASGLEAISEAYREVRGVSNRFREMLKKR